MNWKSAHDFVKILKPEEKFNLIVLKPTFMVGPSLVLNDGISTNFLTPLVDGSQDKVEEVMYGLVDVRDVALANRQVLTDGS